MIVQRTTDASTQRRLSQIQWLWRTGIVLLGISVLLSILLRTYTDPDLWGHLRFGLDMVETRSLVFVDPYSYLSAGQTWINHEWLAELLMAFAWLGGQSAGLVALRVTILTVTFALIFLHLTRLLHLAALPSLAVIVMAVPGMVVSINVVRPQLFTFLLFTITLIVIYQAELGRYRWLWLMPIVVALWVNLHGGFLAGCGILAIWGTLHLIQHYRQWRSFLPPLVVSAIALLVNPYGVTLIMFLLRTATVARPGIGDWQPLELTSWAGASYLLLFAITIPAVAYSNRPKKRSLLVLWAVTALLPFTAIRHLPLMAIAFTVLIGEHVVDIWARRVGKRQSVAPTQLAVALLPLLLAVVIPLAATSIDRGRILIGEALPYPQSAIALLKTSAFRGNLATFFDWGEYIIWHAGPEIKVSIDGRRETVYPDEIYEQHFDFWHGANRWDALVTEHPTDAVLIVRGMTAENLLRLSPEWIVVYEDETSVLFVNSNYEELNDLQRTATEFTPPEPVRYFP